MISSLMAKMKEKIPVAKMRKKQLRKNSKVFKNIKGIM